jgi:hypothetical protein
VVEVLRNDNRKRLVRMLKALAKVIKKYAEKTNLMNEIILRVVPSMKAEHKARRQNSIDNVPIG